MKSMLTAKLNFEKKLSSQNNSNIYKYIQSLTSTLSLPSTVSFDSLSASSDTEKANLFNYFFIQSSHKALLVCHHQINCHFLVPLKLFEISVYLKMMFIPRSSLLIQQNQWVWMELALKSLRTVQWDSINLYTIYL